MSKLRLGLRGASVNARQNRTQRYGAVVLILIVAALVFLLRAHHLRFAPGELTFASIYVRQASDLPISISIDGDAPIAIKRLSIIPPDAPFTVSGCTGVTSGQPCKATVSFHPEREGRAAAQLVVLRTDGVVEPPVPIRGLAEPGNLDFRIPNFEPRVIGERSAAEIAITNRGARPIRILSATLNDTRAFRGDGDECSGKPLPPGASCAIKVLFRPPARETFAAEWTVTDETGTVYRLPLTGRGQLRHFAVSPRDFAFADTYVQKPVQSRPLVVRNDGDVGITIDSVAVTPADAPFTVSGCSGSLEPSAQCTPTIVFRPQSAGAAVASLVFRGGVAGEQSVSLRGSARQVDLAFTTPKPSAILGQQPESAQFAIANRGGLAIRITSIEPDSGPAFSAAADRCTGKELAAGGTCSVDVRFTPQQRGENAATWTVVDETSARHPVPLSGRGLLRHFAVSKDVAFPDTYVGKPVESPLAIINDGDVDIAIDSIAVTPAEAPFTAGRCSEALAPGATCNPMIVFRPLLPGRAAASLVVRGAGGAGDASVALSGSARPVALDIAIPEIRAVVREDPGKAPITIANRGGLPIRIASIEPDGNGAFRAADDGCTGKELAADGTCSVNALFTPRERGVIAARWTVADETGRKHEVPVTGRGLLRHFAVSTTEISFPDMYAGRTSSLPLAIVNDGDVPVTIEAMIPADVPFVAGGCAGQLEPSTKCEMKVAFQPRAEGPSTATLLVRGGGSAGSESVSLSGMAAAVDLRFKAPQFAELIDRRTKPSSIEIINAGPLRLRIVSVVPDGNSQFDTQADRCKGANLPPGGGTCAVDVVFAPRKRGDVAAQWIVADETGLKHEVTVTGRGMLRLLTVSPSSISFEFPTGKYETREVTISNEGDIPIEVAQLTVVPDGTPFNLQGHQACLHELQPQEVCRFMVGFGPKGDSKYAAQLVVFGAGNRTEASVPLSGRTYTIVGALNAVTPAAP
jgi:hypothetical protein